MSTLHSWSPRCWKILYHKFIGEFSYYDKRSTKHTFKGSDWIIETKGNRIHVEVKEVTKLGAAVIKSIRGQEGNTYIIYTPQPDT